MNDELNFEEVKSLNAMRRLLAQQREQEIPEELWMRCALLDRFDAAAYGVLRDGFAGPSFDDLVMRPEIDSVDRFASLKPALRGPYLAKWTRDDAALKAIAGQLADAVADPLESLVLRTIADPAAAKADFDHLYEKADTAFDLSRCNAILAAFRSRALLLDPVFLRDLRNEEQYYRSRVIYADYFWATVVYVKRPELLKPFQKFLGDDQAWLLEIQGPGGLGKSMFLRWLIARHCVPKSEHGRIPVARMDMEVFKRSLEANLAVRQQPKTMPGQVETIWERFDFRTLSETPWLVLLLLAEQLRSQLPDSPLQTLLSNELLDMAQLLERKAVLKDEAYLRSLSREMQDKLEYLFAHGVGQNRLVIVLDTMERLTINNEQLCRSLIEMFGRLRERCPGLHLMVSGRNPILKPLGLAGTLIEIQPFTPDQCREYLFDLRGLPEGPIMHAISDRSEGRPFHLAMLADLSPQFRSAKDVERSDPAMDYLLERVIDQIPDVDVRWLVRYGAVLGRFTKADFAGSVLPILQREQSGDGHADMTVIPPERSRNYANVDLWPRSGGPLDFERAWASLLRYVSPQGWLQASPEGLELLEEVSDSLRALLLGQPVHDELRNAAAEWFAAQGRLLDSYGLRREIYGSGAYRYWPDLLVKARDHGPAYVHSLATRMPVSDLTPDQRGAIFFEASMAWLLGMLVTNPADWDQGTFSQLVLSLDASEKSRRDLPPDQVERVRLVRAAIAIVEKRPTKVPLPLSLARPEEQIAACLLQALDSDPQLRWRHYAQAATIAREHPQAYFKADVLADLAAKLVSNTKPERAWTAYETALTREREHGTPERIGELLVYMHDLADVLGHWSTLRRHARGIASSSTFPAHEQAINTLVRSQLDRFDYPAARTWLERLKTEIQGIRSELAADLSAALYRFGETEDLYRAAREDYERRRYSSSSMTVVLKTARYLLDQYGSPERSLTFNDGMNRNRRFPEPSIGFDFFILRLRQLMAVGQRAEARQLYQDLLAYINESPGLTPLHALFGLGTLLAEGGGEPTDVKVFEQEFNRERNPLATLRPFLTATRDVRTPVPLELKYKTDFRGNRTQKTLYLASALRFFGDPARAANVLGELAKSERPELLRQVRRIAPQLVRHPRHILDEPAFNATFDRECGLSLAYSFPDGSRWAAPLPAAPHLEEPEQTVDVAGLELPVQFTDRKRIVPYELGWELQSTPEGVARRVSSVWPHGCTRFASSDLFAASIPWELGFSGPGTKPYRQLARSSRIPPPPRRAGPLAVLDPFEDYSPDSLTRFYKELQHIQLYGDFDGIVEHVRKQVPRVVHIAAQFHDEERTNESGFQLGREGLLTRATQLGEVLHATPGLQPIVILEPLWLPSDLGRQLLLRNHFAATLARTGGPAAILAIGPYESLDEPQALLRELAAPGVTPRKIYEALFATAQLPYLPALFADDPDELIWSPSS